MVRVRYPSSHAADPTTRVPLGSSGNGRELPPAIADDKLRDTSFADGLRCSCGRVYTPYEQKNRPYYLCRCEKTCPKENHNLPERALDEVIRDLLGYCAFTLAEIGQIEALDEAALLPLKAEAEAQEQDRRNRTRKLQRDLAYLEEQKLSLLREGVYTPEAYRAEYGRLDGELTGLRSRQNSRLPEVESIKADFLRFAELVRNMQAAYLAATDAERHELAAQMFSELVIADEKVAQLRAKDGFAFVLARSFGQELRYPKEPASEPFLADIIVPNFAGLSAKRDRSNSSRARFAAHGGEGFVVSELLLYHPIIKSTLIGMEQQLASGPPQSLSRRHGNNVSFRGEAVNDTDGHS